LGVSEKLSESCKGNFVDAEGGSLGMRRVKRQIHPLQVRRMERSLERERGRGEVERAK